MSKSFKVILRDSFDDFFCYSAVWTQFSNLRTFVKYHQGDEEFIKSYLEKNLQSDSIIIPENQGLCIFDFKYNLLIDAQIPNNLSFFDSAELFFRFNNLLPLNEIPLLIKGGFLGNAEFTEGKKPLLFNSRKIDHLIKILDQLNSFSFNISFTKIPLIVEQYDPTSPAELAKLQERLNKLDYNFSLEETTYWNQIIKEREFHEKLFTPQ